MLCGLGPVSPVLDLGTPWRMGRCVAGASFSRGCCCGTVVKATCKVGNPMQASIHVSLDCFTSHLAPFSHVGKSNRQARFLGPGIPLGDQDEAPSFGLV